MKNMNYVGEDVRTRGQYGEWVREGQLIETEEESEDNNCPVGEISVFDSVFGTICFTNNENWEEE